MSRFLRAGTTIGSVVGFASLYFIFAVLSASTAFVQINTAAVWVPSGFAVGLMIARGLSFWPAVTIGSFAFNVFINIGDHAVPSVTTSIAVALCIALGNTCEALLGGWLARRFASGSGYMANVRSAAVFILIVAPLPPLSSMIIGVGASHLGGLVPKGAIQDVALTWYIGDYVGIMVFTGLTVLFLDRAIELPPRARFLEAITLVIALSFVGQAICGFFLSGWIGDWLKSYMVIPLLLWACFRFQVTGGLLAITIVTGIAVLGTLRGYTAFPSKSPWLALVYLQVFLGMLSVITLAISASLAELSAIRATLEHRVKVRTREIERLMREREVFTVLVAHDLQSPLYGVRNALRASSAAISRDIMSPHDLAPALSVMEQTCSKLADRVASLLLSSRDHLSEKNRDLRYTEATRRPVAQIVENIAIVNGTAIGAPDCRITYRGDRHVSVTSPDAIEHIIDALVDNALTYSPSDRPVEVAAFQHGASIEIHVTDQGPGIPASERDGLFRPGRRPRRNQNASRSGLGLYLAAEEADALGGRLTYATNFPTGSIFRLIVPA